ncbi:MAG TPA: SAM-dependent methyltransferase, partial [Gemmatirosa sp.]
MSGTPLPGAGARGTLYLVSTPIGNLGDITARAAEVLRTADAVLCEDTRHSRRLLDHLGSRAPTLAVHEHNEARQSERLVARLAAG